MEKRINRREQRDKRHRRVRGVIKGSEECPRFSVFRSNQGVFLQLIDDEDGKTIFGLKSKNEKGKTKTEEAFKTGETFGKKAFELKVKKVVFDRGGYKFQGRVKAVAEGARKAGLEF